MRALSYRFALAIAANLGLLFSGPQPAPAASAATADGAQDHLPHETRRELERA